VALGSETEAKLPRLSSPQPREVARAERPSEDVRKGMSRGLSAGAARYVDAHNDATLSPFVAGRWLALLSRMSKNGLTMSSGMGKMTVELCSPLISVNV